MRKTWQLNIFVISPQNEAGSAMEHITLTVFPFENLSHTKDLEIFCRSFSGELATELSRFRQFRVINLLSQVNTADLNSASILNNVTTDYFVQGTFRSEKGNVRINVQLYDGESHQMIWGNRLEGQLDNLNDIQDSLLTEIVGVLQHHINADLLYRIRKRQKVALKAYEHCLYGMEELKNGSVESDSLARDHFRQAMELQPDYALAHTGMSLSYFNEWSCQLWDKWDICKGGAFHWAQKAIELDDHNHIAAMVLGKIFMFEGSYDTAEYYFRKSLLLNPNDPDTVLQIAVGFIFMGFEKESIELHQRVLQLTPFTKDRYAPYAIFIYFELGDFEKAEALIRHNPTVKIADSDAYYAAVYYYLKQTDKMQEHWNSFLNTYRRLISKGKDFKPQEAIDWIIKINPYRNNTRLIEFLRYINDFHVEVNFQRQPENESVIRSRNHFLKDIGIWRISYDGSIAQVPELKGFYDIQKLLIEPHQLFHCAELMGSKIDSHGEKLIDTRAKKQYQEKLLELQHEIAAAEQRNDYIYHEKLQQEYDQLIDYLSTALGLKGQSRESGGTVEKARSAITWRIRKAIARIEQHHPPLGAHLSNAIKTGTVCSYQPEKEIEWVTS